MKSFPRILAAVSIAALVTLAATTTTEASPIYCSGIGSSGAGTASVDPALSCTGTGLPGQAAEGVNDSVSHLNGLGAYGGGWDLLTGGNINAYSGSFVVDPALFSTACNGGPCTEFIAALKWDGLMTYFSLGTLLAATTFNWTTTGYALSHLNVYGRYVDPGLPQVPEPGTLVLFGTGLLAAAHAARRRMSSRGPRT